MQIIIRKTIFQHLSNSSNDNGILGMTRLQQLAHSRICFKQNALSNLSSGKTNSDNMMIQHLDIQKISCLAMCLDAKNLIHM